MVYMFVLPDGSGYIYLPAAVKLSTRDTTRMNRSALCIKYCMFTLDAQSVNIEYSQ